MKIKFTDNLFYSLILSICFLNAAIHAKIAFLKCKNVHKATNFWYANKASSDTSILAFDEVQDLYISKGYILSQKLNKWDNIKNLDTIHITNAYVSSHMVYYFKKATGRLAISAEVEFDDNIIGYQASDTLFAISNAQFAPNPTHTEAPGKSPWSLEEKASLTELDSVGIMSKKRLFLHWTNQSAVDPLRVFTIRYTTGSVKQHSKPLSVAQKENSHNALYYLNGRVASGFRDPLKSINGSASNSSHSLRQIVIKR